MLAQRTPPLTFSVVNETSGLRIAQFVTLAGTSSERRRGLLNLEKLPEETGLWISPCEAIHTFGMKASIDAIFIGRSKRVLKLYESICPRRIGWCLRAESVIELPPGTIRRTQTKVGDYLRLLRNFQGTPYTPSSQQRPIGLNDPVLSNPSASLSYLRE